MSLPKDPAAVKTDFAAGFLAAGLKKKADDLGALSAFCASMRNNIAADAREVRAGSASLETCCDLITPANFTVSLANRLLLGATHMLNLAGDACAFMASVKPEGERYAGSKDEGERWLGNRVIEMCSDIDVLKARAQLCYESARSLVNLAADYPGLLQGLLFGWNRQVAAAASQLASRARLLYNATFTASFSVRILDIPDATRAAVDAERAGFLAAADLAAAECAAARGGLLGATAPAPQ